MPPQTMGQLIDTVYDTNNYDIILTPVTDQNLISSSYMNANWTNWEWTITALVNGLNISTNRDMMGSIMKIPDSIAMRNQTNFHPLRLNMPRESRI